MKNVEWVGLAGFLSLVLLLPAESADFYVSPFGSGTAPYGSWADAATNIQDAIDAASGGDTVWVTNGVYATGGKAMDGDLTSRVALYKPLTVRSVNGPFVSFIEGGWTTNGPTAIRCAWLTNGAVLKDFTLEGGGTRSSGPSPLYVSGGGACCVSSNAWVVNCLIRSNTAYQGGGVYSGSVFGSALTGNSTITLNGSASYQSVLVGCTVSSNAYAAAVYGGWLTNCIVYYNSQNYSASTRLSYCCTTPVPSGRGNIGDPPQLLDGLHLASTSPCIAAGTNVTAGTDLDGRAWGNPPSIGCEQWEPSPMLLYQPAVRITREPVGFTIRVIAAGQTPFSCWWTRDGVPIEDDGHYSASHSTNLVAVGISPSDVGSYQVVLSNAFGMATSAVAQVVVHLVDAANSAPVPPYLTWGTAATNIKDSVDSASTNEFVLVTNGIYAAGGKVVFGDLTNRVVLDKPVIVRSLNGAAFTTIQGAWDPATNGPLAVRCAWLGDGTLLDGFTLTRGATRSGGSDDRLQSGGGVWAANSNTIIANCVICTNAAYNGGGACQGFLKNCTIVGNRAQSGGGAYLSTVLNSVLYGNNAIFSGGGAANGLLVNCTVTRNSAGTTYAGGPGAGVAGFGGGATLRNCIIYGNGLNSGLANYTGSPFMTYCCTTPSAPGIGNTNANPQLLDPMHLASSSPCRGAGSRAYASGVDIDGEPWATPPAMGCDEVWEAAIKGPLSVFILTNVAPVLQKAFTGFAGQVSGRASRVEWDFGDGTVQTNALIVGHSWSMPGDYTVAFTAYNADNPNGVATNLVLKVVPPTPPVLTVTPGSNTLTLVFPAQLSVWYVVEQTTNISPPATWQTMNTVLGSGGPLAVSASTTNEMRFFRVRTQ